MSSRKTLCFTGMGSQEEASLKGLFEQANARLNGSWSLAALNDADVLVIDVDSMYGHMTWLREHNSGRPIVAMSAGEHAEADYVLHPPISVDALARLLGELAGIAPRPAAPEPPQPAAAQAPKPAEAAPPRPEAPRPEKPKAEAPVAAPRAEPAKPPAAPEPAPVVEAPPPPPPRDPMLADYLQGNALPGPVKLAIEGAPLLVLDPKSQTYLGPATLKGFAPYCKRVIRPEHWTAITSGEFDKLKAELGSAQPFMRLQWLCGLFAGDGHIAEGYDQNLKFKLSKWPQIEREYPKHFRIATVMMKGPQLLTEIAEGAGVPLGEVTDFVNANLYTGMAEMEVPPAPVDPNAASKGGLFGRFRGQK
jgi:hypothetical protein